MSPTVDGGSPIGTPQRRPRHNIARQDRRHIISLLRSDEQKIPQPYGFESTACKPWHSWLDPAQPRVLNQLERRLNATRTSRI